MDARIEDISRQIDDDIGMGELREGRGVAVGPEPVAAAHGLDVLLRDRLRPQSGGLEGVGPTQVDLHMVLWRIGVTTQPSGASMNPSGSKPCNPLRRSSKYAIKSSASRMSRGNPAIVRSSCQCTSICGSRSSAPASRVSSPRMNALNASI